MPASDGVDRADFDKLTAELEAIIEDEDTVRDITLHELSNQEVLTLMTVLMDGRERFIQMGGQYQADMLARMVIDIRSQTDDIHEPMEDAIAGIPEPENFDFGGFDDGGHRVSSFVRSVASNFGLALAFLAGFYGILAIMNTIESGIINATTMHLALAGVALVIVAFLSWYSGRRAAQKPF